MNERIYTARKDAGLTQDELAEAVGKTRGAVAQWEAGTVRPRRGTMEMVAKATGKPIAWLESGIDDEQVGLNVVGEVAGGLWREGSVEFQPIGVPVAPHPSWPASAQRLYRVIGPSVNKVVADGEYIHCVSVADSGIRPTDGDLVVVRRTEHGLTEYTAKRLVRADGQTVLRPESFDPAWQSDVAIEGNEGTLVEIIDVVVAKWLPLRRGIF